MSTIVLKFGGTSVATTDLIESAANIVKSEYVKGNNDKARELLNARQPKDNEPNIKDVISGDYSRK